MEETWQRDFDLPVLQAGLAHMVVISREFDFVGGGVYSDTTSWADVDEARLTEGLVHAAIKVSNERSGFGMLGTQ